MTSLDELLQRLPEDRRWAVAERAKLLIEEALRVYPPEPVPYQRLISGKREVTIDKP